MHGQANDARLEGHGAEHRLLHPPRRVCAEPKPAGGVVLFGGSDEPDAPLLHQVLQPDPDVLVAPRDGHHQAHVRVHQVHFRHPILSHVRLEGLGVGVAQHLRHRRHGLSRERAHGAEACEVGPGGPLGHVRVAPQLRPRLLERALLRHEPQAPRPQDALLLPAQELRLPAPLEAPTQRIPNRAQGGRARAQGLRLRRLGRPARHRIGIVSLLLVRGAPAAYGGLRVLLFELQRFDPLLRRGLRPKGPLRTRGGAVALAHVALHRTRG
mmetsp:Transcript_10662/g.24864  ORF Transcript_10662/g.24864 Transcript_10662/m.24864 type:complete len:268 (-) Transcript_10662:289-1092(-)